MFVNTGQKINKRQYGYRTFKYKVKQAVNIIFNLYDNNKIRKKKL
jgi:hypothetical protein